MLKIFELVLRALSVKEIVTKYRRASTRCHYLVLKHLGTVKERILYINNPSKAVNFPKHRTSSGRQMRHFVELFNQIKIRLDPEEIPSIDFNQLAMNLFDMKFPKQVRIAVSLHNLDDTEKSHFAYMRTLFKVFP